MESCEGRADENEDEDEGGEIDGVGDEIDDAGDEFNDAVAMHKGGKKVTSSSVRRRSLRTST